MSRSFNIASSIAISPASSPPAFDVFTVTVLLPLTAVVFTKVYVKPALLAASITGKLNVILFVSASHCIIVPLSSADNDIVVKQEALEALVSSLPSAHHKEMAGVGHAPYCENAEKFNQILEQFVATC